MTEDGDQSRMKRFAILVEQPGMTPNWVQVHETERAGLGLTSVLNPPPPFYTYDMAALKHAMDRVRKSYPDAYVAAHEIGHIDFEALRKSWSEQYDKRKPRND